VTPEEHATFMQQLAALEANIQRMLASPLRAATPAGREEPPRRPGVARPVFGHIALACKGALAHPGLTDVQRMYLLEIARVCKRMLERE
jgi:hypothetical protein